MAPAMFMSEKSIEEYIEKMRNRYARMTGRRGRRGKRGAPKPYDTDTRDALKTCWLSMNQPCGKRITDMLPLWSRPPRLFVGNAWPARSYQRCEHRPHAQALESLT